MKNGIQTGLKALAAVVEECVPRAFDGVHEVSLAYHFVASAEILPTGECRPSFTVLLHCPES